MPQHQDPADTLKTLVRFNTSNPPGNEAPLLHWLASRLDAHGIAHCVLPTAPGRGNLVALLPGQTGAAANKALVLLSHIDVVGAEAERWLAPPFAAEEKDGYIYGRGTVDTKQLTAMQLHAFIALAQSGVPRTRDVWLVATCDEECGSTYGLLALLETEFELCGRRFSGKALFAGSQVISEGGGFPILVDGRPLYLCEAGQKGVAHVTLTAKSKEDKGPFLPGTDGFCRAAAAVEAFSNLRAPVRLLPAVQSFIASLQKQAGLVPQGSPQADVEALLPFISPFMGNILRAMLRTTVAVTLVEGRDVRETRITLDCRLLPGEDQAGLEALLAPIAESYALHMQVDAFSPGYASDVRGGLFNLLAAATGECLGQAVPVLPFFSIGSSDGRHLAPLGASVYGYSPTFAWDITFDTAVPMVHGDNERIHPDSVRFGADVLSRIINAYAIQNDTDL